jgi:Outer membrane lipoprotein carrier protein LolA-like
MISGTALLTALTLLASPPPDAAALIAKLARPVPSTTAYAEVRFMRMFRAPLVLHGELEYGGADSLAKRVEQPYRETTSIANASVSVQREGRSERKFALDRAPELQALLAGFSALLGGDAATLQKFYTVALVENSPNWTLTLTPLDADLGRHLRDIVVDGAASEPRCFTLHEADGDASVMLLGALAAEKIAAVPTPAQLAGICRRVEP